MKTLLLIRHAKSSWDFDVDDFERPLSTRGKSDVPKMAKRLLDRQITIDRFVTSPAKRAMTTAQSFADTFKGQKPVSVSALYEATIQVYEKVIGSLSDEFNTIALFAHNPTITDFANQLTTTKIDDMPTCAIFAVQAEISNWKDFMISGKAFLFFDYPKAL